MERARAGVWRLWLLPALAATALLRAPIADVPLERDEGEYAYIAREWRAGVPPYRSAFDQKPPGVFAVYAAAQALGAGGPAGVHWAAQLWTWAALGCLFLIGRRWFGPLAAALGCLLAGAAALLPCFLGSAANTEVFMLLPAAAAVAAALRAADEGSPPWAAAAGALAGAACLFKQVAAADAAFAALLLAALARRRRGPLLGAFAAGAAGVLGACAAYFALAGAWEPFVDGVLRYNARSYASRMPLGLYPSAFIVTFIPIALGAWPVLLLASAGAARPDRPARWALAWLGFSLLGVSAGGYFRDHYFLQALPAAALLAGRGAERLAGLAPPSRRTAWSWGLAAAAVLVCAGQARWYFSPGPPEAKSRRLYSLNPFPESPELGRFIASRTAPGDTVFIFGSEPQILYYSGRRSASRYIFAYPLLAGGADGDARQREALDEVRRARPRYVLFEANGAAFLAAPDATAILAPALSALLRASYRRTGAVVSDLERGRNELILGEDALARRRKAGAPGWTSLALWERRG